MLSEKIVAGASGVDLWISICTRTSFQVLFALVLFFSVPIILVSSVCAQDAPAQNPAAQDSTSSSEPPPQTAQQRRIEARQMQTRRELSHKRRIQQVIDDTYNHRFEIYGGGMYTRFRPGPYLHNAGTGGWALGVTDYLTSRWGISGDARGYYGSSSITINNPYDVHNASFSAFTFTSGPQYRFYKQQHFAVSAALQGGIIYGYFDADTNGFQPQLVGLYPPDVVLGGIFSIHADYNLSPGLAVRFSPNVLMGSFNGDFQHQQGFLMGVVYRFDRHSFQHSR